MRTFPIFVSVERKPPLVTGGGELAAIKTRLLLKRAEIVDVAAGELGPELAELERAGRVALIACAARRRSDPRAAPGHCRHWRRR